jgi:TatD DNase family protein
VRRIELEREAMTEPTLSLADSHTHIDMPGFDADREAVVSRAQEAGVERMLLVGCADAEAGHRRALAVAEALGQPCSAGAHPHDAKLAGPALWDEIRGLAREGRLCAVGEVGLDFHYDHSPRDVQRAVFREQVRLARDLGLPLIVHTREADAETCEILEGEGAGEVGGVIHCFTGAPELARRSLALGFSISFSGIATFPKAGNLREIAKEVPRERLLVETDAPFLAPVPHRGKRNEPAFVVEVVRCLADVRGESVESLAASTRAGFERLFGGGAAGARSV